MTTHTPDQTDTNLTHKKDAELKELGGKLTLAIFISIPSVLFMNPTLIGLSAKIPPGSYMEGLVWSILALVSVPVFLWSGSHLFVALRENIKKGSLNLNDALTVLLSIGFAYSLAISIIPGVQSSIPGARPFWDIIPLIVALFAFKKYILHKKMQN